jgi:hypothetical protein
VAELSGNPVGTGRRIAVVASRFNENITRALVDGALDALVRHGAAFDDIDVIWVPGAWELPIAVRRAMASERYEAVVAGQMAQPSGTIDLPLARDWPRRPLQKVDTVAGRPAVTNWSVLSFGADTSRVALEPVTGRTHQLRVHLLAIGHPILGDPLYAPDEVRDRAPRLLLHATRLALAHPASGDALVFESPAPFQE